MTLLFWHVWQRRWFILWWTIGLCAFIALELSFYPAFKDQGQQLNEVIGKLPPAARALISGSGDYFSPIGYMSARVYYILLPLLLGIAAINIGNNVLTREERDGTLELLLARPVSRTKLITAKFLFLAGTVTFLGSVSGLCAMLLAKAVDIEVGIKHILAATVVCILLCICFGLTAFVFSAIGRIGRGLGLGIAVLVAFGGYIVSSLTQVAGWLKPVAKVLPFHYYQPDALFRGEYNWRMALYYAGYIVAAYIISVITFRRRDIG